jgi:hypothetical protein
LRIAIVLILSFKDIFHVVAGLFDEYTWSDLSLSDMSWSDDQDLSGWCGEFRGYRTGLFDENTRSDLPLSDPSWSKDQDLSGWSWGFRGYHMQPSPVRSELERQPGSELLELGV